MRSHAAVVISVGLLVALVSGCLPKRGEVQYVEMVWSHDHLTQETNTAVIRSIRADLESRSDLSPDAIVAINDLIERLEMIKLQSALIRQYVDATQVDSDLISKMLQARWKE